MNQYTIGTNKKNIFTTLDLDDLCLTDARQYLGLTLVWLGKLEEATEHFELDVEDRGVRLSGFFALWCILCCYEEPPSICHRYEKLLQQLGWLDVDGKPTDDDWDKEQGEVLHTRYSHKMF